MGAQLQRIAGGSVVEEREFEGRRVRLLQSKHKSSVVARCVVVAGGPHTPRVEGASYRGVNERTFDIDPILVRPETGADRFGKALGLNLEASLGADEIDRKFYFETDTRPEIVRDLFADPALRDALLRNLERGDDVVIGPPGGAVAVVRSEGPTTLELRDDVLVPLVRLAGALPLVRARPPKSMFAHALPMLGLSMAIQLGVMPAVFVGTSSNGLSGSLVFRPILVGVAAAVVLAFTVFLALFRKRANGFRPWIITSIGTAIAFSGIGVALANYLNEELDTAKPRVYEALVVQYRTKIKKKQSGLLLVRGLPASLVEPGAGGAQEIDYRFMPPNDRVFPNPSCRKLALSIAPGRFGNPWVAGSRCLP
jgi:hypothetical protein